MIMSQSETFSFNVNKFVRVKLTERGRKLHREDYDKLNRPAVRWLRCSGIKSWKPLRERKHCHADAADKVTTTDIHLVSAASFAPIKAMAICP